MGRIYLVRHGQASLLANDYDQLSALGTVQSRAVGEWLGPRVPAPQAVVSGSLERQLDTARACAASAGWRALPMAVDPGFDEYSHHDLFEQAYPHLADPAVLGAHLRASEHPRREFHALFESAFASWLRGETAGRDGLTWTAFRERSLAALRAVAQRCGSGQSAVVVTSGGPISAICQELLGLPDERVITVHNRLFNASITQLLTQPGQIALSVFNSVAHLELQPGTAQLITYR